MKRLLIIIRNLIKLFPDFCRTLLNAYKNRGFSSVNISYINYGETLKNKNILITGGSSGIGFSIAKKCISEGASVIITGRSEQKLSNAKSELNNNLLKTLKWDVTDINTIEENLDKCFELLDGKIDILVNNAGIVNSVDFPNVTEQIWTDIYDTNSKGVYFITQAICKVWLKKNKINCQRKIINISSQGGFVGATYPYRMTKWDIAGLTQGLGVKLAPHGIIVNGIAPGIIATPVQKHYMNRDGNMYCSLNPLERYALPEEIAELAVFLMSDSTNFIVGQTIICDGGYSIK